MKGKFEIDQDSFSCYSLIWGCRMISGSSELLDDMALLMPMFLHNLMPIKVLDCVTIERKSEIF